MKTKKLFTTLLTVAMTASMMFSNTAFAAGENTKNGTYTGTVHMHNASNPANYSMCDSMFYRYADVVLTDDATKITVFVGSPLSTFPGIETLGETTATYNGETYVAEIDSTTKPEKTFDSASALGGIAAGDVLTCQVLTFTLPADAVDALEDGIAVAATVNAMGSAPDMIMKITDLSATSTSGDTTEAETSENKSMEVTAEVVAQSATYSVVIPESVALGSLSTEKDNEYDFNVSVDASNLTNNGKVVVSAPTDGTLTSGKNTLAFTNSFGTQNITTDADNLVLAGKMTVKASDVSSATAGNYSGSTVFTISYYAD